MSWNDDELSEALKRYEAIGRSNGMKENAIHSYWDYARRFIDWRKGAYHPRGARIGSRPTPIGRASTEELRAEAKAYARAIEDAGRAKDTIDTYYRHAMFFVRWLEGTFVPGSTLRR